MNLLLDARKKLQQAQAIQEGPHAANTDIGDARDAVQNLFDAKSRTPMPANRNLLFVLGGTILLSGIGAAYSWHIDSSARPLHLATTTAPAVQQPIAQTASTSPQQATPIPAATIQKVEPEKPSAAANTATDTASRIVPADPVHIRPHKTEKVDPLLTDAYVAYRSGRLDEAQQLYLHLLRKNPVSPDILLGLAGIAQQRGEKQTATQYYARVLALDPRNAVANAGMSALSEADDRNENRLKMLLREQGDSALLYFALGNLYAGQSRWSEAQQAYFSAYTLEPGNAEFAFNLSVSLDHIGQRKLAVQHYRRALELDEPHGAGFDRAQVLQRLEELAR